MRLLLWFKIGPHGDAEDKCCLGTSLELSIVPAIFSMLFHGMLCYNVMVCYDMAGNVKEYITCGGMLYVASSVIQCHVCQVLLSLAMQGRVVMVCHVFLCCVLLCYVMLNVV